jgi:hypothetical protein
MKLTGLMFQVLGINHNHGTSHKAAYHLGRHAAKQPNSMAIIAWPKVNKESREGRLEG